MLKYAMENEDEYIQKRALKNIEWVLSEQNENGFFNYASFLEETPAFLHTIIYILEGLLDVYNLTQQHNVLHAVLANANRLKEINIEQDMLLCSQYNDDYTCTNKERCITGLAQWAGVCLRLYKITNDEAFKYIAISTLFYLKSKQIQEGKVLKGALPASVPFWGKYGMFSFVNWGNKFFIDSLLMLDQYKISIAQEQESWVSQAFGFNDEVVHTELSTMDMQYLEAFNRYFEKYKNKKLTLLDLGCGRGRFLDYLKKHYPKWKIIGIDPTFKKENEILKGSAYSISLPDASVDILFTVEVLQHTYIEQSMYEINRVVRSNGYLVIGERNPLSILGLLKPILELKGKWMYPWDSPFRERWYSLNRWKNFLRKFNFKIEKTEIINNPNDKKIKFLNRYYFMIGEKN
jgi:SAM-dependent methyltransferase